MNALVLIPLIVILVLMLNNKHMLIAGMVGGICAMVIGKVGLTQASSIISAAIPGMTGMITPIIYSTTALVVAKAGGFRALMKISRKLIGDKQYIIAAFIVLIQSLATYAAGLGAGNTMVTGPLAFSIIGANPSVIAGMALGTAASFMTSPSSADAATISKIANISITDYTDTMLAYTVGIWVIAMIIAAYGVWKKGVLIQEEDVKEEETTMKTLWKNAIPPIYFLIVVVASKYLNQIIGYHLFSPIFNMISTLALIVVITKQPSNNIAEDLVQNSAFLLIKLFSIGIFLGFINILSEIGTFTYIAGFIKVVPQYVSVPVAILIAFLVAVPAGGYSVGVTALIMPILVESQLSIVQLGLAALAIGVGTQISPAQINVASLSESFKLDMRSIIKINMPYMAISAAFLCIIGFVL